MRKTTIVIVLAVCILAAATTLAHAGIWEKGKALITGEVAAVVFSSTLVLLGGTFGVVFKKLVRTFNEAGEFLSVLGEALEDTRLTREELSDIIKEGRDIFAVWG